jgi:hypothetical protein
MSAEGQPANDISRVEKIVKGAFIELPPDFAGL